MRSSRWCSAVAIEKHGVAGPKSVEDLWRLFFSDPSQWWDYSKNKVNSSYPDYKHSKSGSGLWIDGRWNPRWVKTQLGSMPIGCVPQSPFFWNAKLSRYVKNEQGQEALDLFRQMQAVGVKPDSFTLVMICNACSSLGVLEEARYAHAMAIQTGYESNVFVGSSLVDMYAKCGSLDDALRVFNDMPNRNVVAWNAAITGCVKCQQGRMALEFYRRMQAEDVNPNNVTFALVLNSCASLEILEEGKLVHEQVNQSGCQHNLLVANSLVDMYAKCGSIHDAWRVFHCMSTRDVVSWNALLLGYVKCEQEQKALKLYQQMQAEGIKPTHITFAVVLNACAGSGALEEGRLLHAQVIADGFESYVRVGNCLLDMYAKCGSTGEACRVFQSMPTRNVISWSTILTGCVKGEHALKLFEVMQEEGMKPDAVMFAMVCNTFANLGALEEGRFLHAHAIQSSSESHMFVGNALINMYGKCGSIDDAWRVFSSMLTHDVVSWNSMLAGCVKFGQGQKALELFEQMQAEYVKPNTVTFVMACNACASLEALEEGRRVHAQVIQSECDLDVFVGNSLVDMYAKCGSIDDAWATFHSMPSHNVVSWNTMLGGLAIHGYGKEVVQVFELICKGGVEVDKITFVCLLSACSHGGLVEEGLWYFKSMSSQYGITPTAKHYTCVIDLLGRAGRLDEAEDFVSSEPKLSEDIVLWMALLGACRNQEKGLNIWAQWMEVVDSLVHRLPRTWSNA